jgi:hypothetical protein
MEEYLTTAELSDRIKMTPGTIRNLVWQKKLKKNVHYVKPTQGKLLFKWRSVEEWLHNRSSPVSKDNNLRGKNKCLIRT